MDKSELTLNSAYVFDLDDERLWRAGTEVPLTPKSYSMLRYFVTHPDRLLTKEVLLRDVWPGIYVSESQVKQVVQNLRKALCDNPSEPCFIQTVHRRGYRYIGSMTVIGPDGEGERRYNSATPWREGRRARDQRV